MKNLQNAFIAIVVVTMLSTENVSANSATWNANPNNGDWNNATNWSAGGPPNGPGDVATFGFSNTVDLFLSGVTEVSGITFNENASAYTIKTNVSSPFVFSGTGIVNTSGIMQNSVIGYGQFVSGVVRFTNNATAGSAISFTNSSSTDSYSGHGLTEFRGTSNAGSATFNNNGGRFGSGLTEFYDYSSAANAIFSNKGVTYEGFDGGSTIFHDSSTAGNGAAGNFDISLPLTGEPGVECRSSNGNYTLVFTTGVADVQTVAVMLSDVHDSFGQVLPDKTISMNVLIGDTNGNKLVNASDVGQTKGQVGMPVTATNDRMDINVDGAINASDVGLAKVNGGHGLGMTSLRN